LENDEEEVEDLCVTGKIEEILCAISERKTKGPGSGAKEDSPFRIRISVEPTMPCVTKTSEEEKKINRQVIIGRRIFTGLGSSGKSTRSISSSSNVVKYLHHVKVVVQQTSQWQVKIQLLGYQSFEVKGQRN